MVKCLLTSSVSALRCALIPWLAVCLGLSLRTGMIGGLLSAFYIGALATDIKGDWAEAYAATAMVGLFLAAIRISETARLTLRSAAVLGFWWGLALLLSPALASVLGSFILVGALRFLRQSPRQYVQFVAVLGMVAALVISPWPIRNAIRLGSPIWAKDNFGIMLLNSNHPGAGWDVFGNETFIEQTTPSWQPAVALKLKAVGEVAYDKSQAEEAKQWIRANPGTFARAGGPARLPLLVPARAECACTRSWRGASPLVSIAGLYLLYFRHRAAALLILGIWIFYPPVYYIMLWSSRYRYPINWTLMLTAAVAMNHAFSAVTRRRDLAVARRPVNLRVKLLADYYVGGTLQAILKPATVLLGKILRRDHDLARCSSLTFIKMMGGGSLVIAYPALLATKNSPQVKQLRLITTSAVKPFAEILGVFDEIIVIRDDSAVTLLAIR